MARLAIAPELIWLRHYVAEPCEEIEISVEAEEMMRSAKIGLPEVMNLLRTGEITYSERLRVGANIVITGRSCDEEMLEAVCWIESGTVRVCVLKVRKLQEERKNDEVQNLRV
jgi:hypothetical protein